MFFVYEFAILEPRTNKPLGRVKFCKDLWDCYLGREKRLANSRPAPSNDPKNHCATHFLSRSLLVSSVANSKSRLDFGQVLFVPQEIEPGIELSFCKAPQPFVISINPCSRQ